jgi:N-acetylglucosaminyl-diphospho-decaprenol L-rhamnosyltransferase
MPDEGADTRGASAPDISVAVVSYNTRDLLRVCLHSLLARQGDGEAQLEIIVADNGSVDGSPEMVRSEFPDVRVLETGGNIGFGRANNAALAEASGRYYCLLNSDAELLPGALSLAMATLEAHADIGLVGGQLLWPDGRLQTSWGDDPKLSGVLAEQTFWEAVRERFTPLAPQTWGGGAAFDVDQICGAFMLLRREAWFQIGGFDPSYFMYNEDVDLNVRLRKSGWRVVFLPTARITHHLGASSSADWRKRALMVSAYNQSRYYYFTRFQGVAAGRTLRAYCLLGAAIRLTGWTVLSLMRPSARDKVKLFQEVWRQTWGMGAKS